MHYVYLIESVSQPAVRYIGYTTDLRRRFHDHNAGKSPATKGVSPWRLRTYLAFSSKMPALRFERYLKNGSGHAFAQRHLW
jgi:predicted GIY-YIG superfamily endonuclease